MRMPEIAKVVTTDAEIDAAIERARIFEKYDRRVASATYSSRADALMLRLEHGVTYSIPRRLIQGLRDAQAGDLQNIELLGNGTGLNWPTLDVAHSVNGLLAGVFGSASWMKQLEVEAVRSRMTA
jgi:predicted TPR repeat methyltransferase